jgi:hypothetical protein
VEELGAGGRREGVRGDPVGGARSTRRSLGQRVLSNDLLLHLDRRSVCLASDEGLSPHWELSGRSMRCHGHQLSPPTSSISSTMMSLQRSMHSSQMYAPAGPAISFLTSRLFFPQKEQLGSEDRSQWTPCDSGPPMRQRYRQGFSRRQTFAQAMTSRRSQRRL